ncbi:hypothetical protein [Marinomonas gallaica]|nr:hypothetical protein [Marinomonas gallaica]
MRKNSVKRYQDRKVPLAYALVDLFLPGTLLFLLVLMSGSGTWASEYHWMSILSGIFLVACIGIQGGYSRYNERAFAKKLQVTTL